MAIVMVLIRRLSRVTQNDKAGSQRSAAGAFLVIASRLLGHKETAAAAAASSLESRISNIWYRVSSLESFLGRGDEWRKKMCEVCGGNEEGLVGGQWTFERRRGPST